MEWTKVPVISISHLSETEKRALILADNKIAANAGWDRKILAAELGELAVLLPEFDSTLEITGFETGEIDSLMGDFIDPNRDPVDELPQLASEPISQPDDLWQLGNHRLLCGDSCEVAHVRALMGRQLAAMIFARSSIQRAYQGSCRPRQNQASGVCLSIRRDVAVSIRRLPEKVDELLRPSFPKTDQSTSSAWIGAILRRFSLPARTSTPNSKTWSSGRRPTPAREAFYRSQHELILVFKNGDAPHQNNIELGPAWTQPLKCLDICGRQYISGRAARRIDRSSDRQAGRACCGCDARLFAPR